LLCWYWWNVWPSLFRGDFSFFDIGGIVEHNQYQQRKQSCLNSDGQQFHQYQQNK
jgi:hypothetical protein